MAARDTGPEPPFESAGGDVSGHAAFQRGSSATQGTAGLKTRTIRGGAITAVSQAAKFGLTMVSTVLLARILSPQDYGLVGMVTTVTGFLKPFTDGGLSSATVQRESLTHELMSTVFWINTTLGVAMTLVSLALAPILVSFYGEPRLFYIGVALAMTFTIDAATAQHQALLRREMRFRALAGIEVLSTTSGLAIGVCLALMGFGYWALVWMQIGTSVVSAVAVCSAEPWRPGRLRKGSGESGMVRFGAFLTATNILNYLFRNFDNVLVGWRWGAGALGLYQKAYGLLMLPITQVNAPISNVAVVALSRLQGEPVRQRRYFVQGYSIATSLTLPVVVAAYIFADDLVKLLLGAKWVGAVLIFRLLAPAALVGALLGPFGWIYLATGTTDRQMKAGVVWCGLIVLAFFVGLPYGPAGVAACYSGIAVLLMVPVCLYAIHGTAIRFRDVFEALQYPTIAALTAGAAGIVLEANAPSWAPVGLRALGGCLMVTAVHAFVLLVVLRQWRPYQELIRHLLPSRRVPEPAAKAI